MLTLMLEKVVFHLELESFSFYDKDDCKNEIFS